MKEGPTWTDVERGYTRLRMLMSKMKANVMRNATKLNKKIYIIVFDYYNFYTCQNI